ncbi:periplasmic glucans biosynthesis protein [Pseudoalteromonas espejiana DSM 9414]|uniref:Glucan biosynthesis protein D n=1 Tax=Pseudoalteromonas espejiana TaxID=28107 RepID=A0A510XTK4_9GAMM|nr:glucan biosynthesis protein [Pseudoalteromonas espejiana]ASM51950.1 periplasmic glucans biosynthesis protein [Pseudoalteromonas espejiana DSM 9414]GEK54366.1 glucan biosynthesis protein D [Pseudoalteromonas espejiana]
MKLKLFIAAIISTSMSLHAEPAQASANFTFEDLKAMAKASAEKPYTPTAVPAPELIDKITYDEHWKIRFKEGETLYPNGKKAPLQLFYPGRYFPEPVSIYIRDDKNNVKELPFSNALFDMPDDSPAHDLPQGFGFAGFRIMRPDIKPDWISFLGASYFRTDGPQGQYGLSARGIAINTGMSEPEEFPRFSAFWIGPAEKKGESVSVWALLEGPSITGAYRFGLSKDNKEAKGHITSVSANLYMRADVERLGIAPLTSMYWYSEKDKTEAKDWRPEIHDSDGLAIHTGSGQYIWRPLNNPQSVSTNSFIDENPKGFGLIQRDRDFNNYQDDGVFYNKRSSAWIKPQGDWGKGAVQLVEIPTKDETFDNIVAYWVPEKEARKGDEFTFSYDIEWRPLDPKSKTLASVVNTRQGQGGIPGQPIPEGVNKMVIDFEGPVFKGLDRESGIKPIVEASNGEILEPIGAYPIVGTNQWRLAFDYKQSNNNPVHIRAYLVDKNDEAITETWVSDAKVTIE